MTIVIIFTICSLLLMHYLGDWVWQTPWMADNKSKNGTALLAHVAVYTLTMSFGMLLMLNAIQLQPFIDLTPVLNVLPGHQDLLTERVFFWGMLNGVLHLLQDDVTSEMTTKAWAAKDYRKFFLTIGTDQVLHYHVLIISWCIIIGFVY